MIETLLKAQKDLTAKLKTVVDKMSETTDLDEYDKLLTKFNHITTVLSNITQAMLAIGRQVKEDKDETEVH